MTNLCCCCRASTIQDKLHPPSRKTLPHVIACRMWRWPDLQNCNELRSAVSHCSHGYRPPPPGTKQQHKSDDHQSHVCINPYHYQRTSNSTTTSAATTAATSSNNNLTVFVPKLPPPPPESVNANTTIIAQQQQEQQQQITDSPMEVVASLPPTVTDLSACTSSLHNTHLAIGSGSDSDFSQHHQIPSFRSTSDAYGAGSGSMAAAASPSPLSVFSPPSIGSLGGGGSSGLGGGGGQFSPFISEDDASEINDINPSPMETFDVMPVTMIEQPYWCSLSYYEMKQRVGEMFHVASDVHAVTIDGYTDPSSAQRFCLGVLSNVNRTSETEMTRHHIGRGLQLSYENGQVFAECLSENPVFVQSPNCNQRYNWHLATVVKIPPGCSLKIFDEADFVQLANETVYQGFEAVYALTRICTIRISFVKGWGAEYRSVTHNTRTYCLLILFERNDKNC